MVPRSGMTGPSGSGARPRIETPGLPTIVTIRMPRFVRKRGPAPIEGPRGRAIATTRVARFVRKPARARDSSPRPPGARSLRPGAPFHHLVDSCLRQGRFGSDTFGSTAYLAAKAKGDRSMPSKRGTPEDVYDVAPQDPHDKVKVGLLEPQSPAVYKRTPRYHVCSEDPRDTRFRRTTSEGFHSGERPPYSGGTGRTGHLTRAMTSTKSRRRHRLWGASPRATEPS